MTFIYALLCRSASVRVKVVSNKVFFTCKVHRVIRSYLTFSLRMLYGAFLFLISKIINSDAMIPITDLSLNRDINPVGSCVSLRESYLHDDSYAVQGSSKHFRHVV